VIPYVGKVHKGLRQFLKSDAALQSLASGGVAWDLPKQTTTGVFVLIRLQGGSRWNTHDRGGYVRLLYQVTAVEQGESGVAADAAAERLHDLLLGQRWPVADFAIIRCEPDPDFEPIALTEPDGDRRWQHRGEIWEVFAAPTVVAA
jgi:hypothetical protein